MLKKLLLGLLVAMSTTAFAQTPWTDLAEQNIPAKLGSQRYIMPRQYRTVQLDIAQLQPVLTAAPERFTTAAADHVVVLTLPMPDGGSARFRLTESPVMAPELQAKFPEIRCYSGAGIDDPTASLKCDLTPQGFHAMIRSSKNDAVFIDPYRQGDTEHYIVYVKKALDPEKEGFACHLDGTPAKNSNKATGAIPDLQGDCQLRRYRLALACTGEYAQFHGGTTVMALAAMNTTMNRVNDIYERDLSITMQLIGNNNVLVFLNSATDGYTNGNAFNLLNENQTKCNTVIGSANYDIGHVFGTETNFGASNLGVICNNSTKAQGATGSVVPAGDPFDIDYVAHEMGHQFGANHTFNNSCGNNINVGTAFEPGSGSTIMGYAGICAPDVQSNSDDYFHAASLQEISAYVTTSLGNVCPVKINTGNTAPLVDAGPDYIIPKSTPFALTANATDATNNNLTYCWEQMDNQIAAMPPAANNTGGPMFRSLDPESSPTRFFPNLPDLVNNTNPVWEELPGVARTLNFRVTARDNNPAGGCTHEDDLKLTVSGTAGPFIVTAPNSALTWTVGDEQTVTWNVANTNQAPVNCAQVRLLLSTDGGFTYPVVLASAVPNNGSALVEVPNIVSTTCRVKVESVGNVFFDISNQNFQIQAPANPSFILSRSVSATQVCLGEPLEISASVEGISGFTGSVEISLNGAPTGASVQINPATLSSGDTATIQLSNLNTPGTYTLVVQGQSGTITRTRTIDLTVLSGAPAAPAPGSPADGSVSMSQGPVLSWQAIPNVLTYQVQVATSPGFEAGSVLFDQTVAGLSATVPGLDTATVYYWRLLANNLCGQSGFSTVYAFQTGYPECFFTYNSTNVPVNISSTAVVTVMSTINVPANRFVADVDLSLQVNHTWVGDLVANLYSPSGNFSTLFDQPGFPATDFGCGGDNLNLTLNDEATASAANLENTCGNNPAINGSFKPVELLDRFDNENAQGAWKLEIIDNFPEDGGALTAWSLKLCFVDTVPAAELLVNDPLTVLIGSQGDITTTQLVLTIASGNPNQGLFTLLSLPLHGTLTLNGVDLGIGSTFTQADILAGAVTYTHNGDNSSSDTFQFDVLDESSNGWIHSATFQIIILQNDLDVEATITQPLQCNGDANGQITVTVTGGTQPLQYSLNGGIAQFGNTFGNLAAGTYTVVVTDQNNFTAESNVVILNNPAAINAGAVVTNDDITVNAAGGTGALEYSLDGQNFQSENIFENQANGTYTVTVRDANGCTTTVEVVVDVQALALQLEITAEILCAGNANGALAATVSGGVAPYTYSLNGLDFQNENTFGGLSAGTYTVVVRDDSGNTVSSNAITLDDPDPLTVSASVIDDDITVNAGGGTGALEYSLDGQNFQSSPLFENQPNGFYTVTVRDANGCTATAEAAVAVDQLLVQVQIVANNLCNGGSTSEILVNAAGGVAPYSYSLNGVDFQNENTFSGLAAGAYTVVVKDDSGNTTTSAVTLIDPPVISATSAANLNVITVTASGGTGALSYSIDNENFQSSNIFGNLENGAYTITVRDANGCTTTTEIIIDVPPLEILEINGDGIITCDGANYTFIITATGGIPPYAYSLNGGPFQDENVFENVGAGTHIFQVRDALGAVVESTPLTITDPAPLTATAEVQANDATILVSGGGPFYVYSINGGASQSSNVFINLPNGAYTVTVTDINGCTTTVDFTIDYTILSATFTTTNPSCAGYPDGSVEITLTGGTPPYLVMTPFTDLPAGAYTVVVTDAVGDTIHIDFTLTDPPLLIASATVSLNTITVTASGGTGALTYSIDGVNFQSEPVFADLPNGTYDVWVRDENGCVTQISDLVVDVISTTDIGREWGLSVQPNPGPGRFDIVLRMAPAGDLTAVVFDAAGRRVGEQVFTSPGGAVQETLDLSSLPAGVYWLRLVNGQKVGTVKLVIQ